MYMVLSWKKNEKKKRVIRLDSILSGDGICFPESPSPKPPLDGPSGWLIETNFFIINEFVVTYCSPGGMVF